MTCDPFDVVVVPFPFTESAQTVKRPALVLSRRAFNRYGQTVMAMVTDLRNRGWPLDTPVDYQALGLKMPSVVRMKFFTLDNRLISRRLANLTAKDREAVLSSLGKLLPGAGRP